MTAQNSISVFHYMTSARLARIVTISVARPLAILQGFQVSVWCDEMVVRSKDKFANKLLSLGGLARRFLKESTGVRYDNEATEWDISAFVPLEVKAGTLVLLHGDLVHQRFFDLTIEN